MTQFIYLIDIVEGTREIRSQYTIKNAIEVYIIDTKDSQLEGLMDQCLPYIKNYVMQFVQVTI